MKLFILLCLLSFHVFADVNPVKGIYKRINGNEESICDQILRPTFKDSILTSISIEYSGWCSSQGPYRYNCNGSSCSDGLAIFVEFKSDKEYRWENRQYGFFCEFKLESK